VIFWECEYSGLFLVLPLPATNKKCVAYVVV
jgi:hypothetical protein